MKILKDIVYKITVDAVQGDTNVQINKITYDTREVQPGDVFVALSGTRTDGHKYIAQAEEKGAAAIVSEATPGHNPKVTYIQTRDSHEALGIMAANYYDNPSAKLKLIGITGTNGKTTTATLLNELYTKSGKKAGLLSTVKVLVADMQYEATHTTPDPIAINKHLYQMNRRGVSCCFMEVSSHAIHQKRIAGLHFAGGVFTNITHEHLDYHKSFKDYLQVKKTFFDLLPKTAFALTNADDKNGSLIVQNTRAKKYTYALKTAADFKAKILENNFGGLVLSINGNEVYTKLAGTFNASNILAVYSVASLLGIEDMDNLRIISELKGVSGRFQHFVSKKGIVTIVDYAHTPDALKNVLKAIGDIRTRNEKLITVIGCGGERDKEKRPKMARTATQLSDRVIFTSDNPRNEPPENIIEEMERGVPSQDYKKTCAITDREQAITKAFKMAQKGDIVLVAGKGHETYQEIKGTRHHFDDTEVIENVLRQLKK